jgi:F0F1-type ATP synthase membrane subunit b/b'
VKPALQRLRDAYSTKARDLADQLLSLQEQHDSMRELLAEREEENRNAEAQVGASGCVGGWVGVV